MELYRTVDRYTKFTYQSTPRNENELARALKNGIRNTADSPDVPSKIKSQLLLSLPILDQVKSTKDDLRTATVQNVSVAGEQIGTKSTSLKEDSAKFIINRSAWIDVREILGKVVNQDLGFAIYNRTNTIEAEVDRLNTQIFRPDCFFAAPPRCNVIFPDQYTQFQFSRNFLQETTRLRLSIDWLFGGDSGGLLAEYYFAPDISQIQEISKKQGNTGLSALLPWEIYSGILPKFETIHEVNYIAGQAERRRGIKGNLRGAVTNYSARTANFNYMKYRFASRTCDVTTKFNPFLVAGFPAVIIERPFILEPERAQEIRNSVLSENASLNVNDMSDFVRFAARLEKAPTQYLGMIAAMSHNVQQDGGSTSVALTHARTHRVTDDDFLGVLSKQLTTDVTTTTISSTLDADDLLSKGDFRKLKFLMDATPQNLQEQAQTIQDETDNLEDQDSSPAVESRPVFAGLLANPTEKPVRVTIPSSRIKGGTEQIPLRGKVKKDRLKDSRQTILVPDIYGKLKVGSTGPGGGKIVQIQCVTDAAIGVLGKSLSKSGALNKKTSVSKPGVPGKTAIPKKGDTTPTSFGISDPSAILSGNTRFTELTLDKTTGKLYLKGNTIDSSDVVFLWKKIVIFEEIKAPKFNEKILPVEEGIRPPWFSPLYSNWFIGDGIYQPFFGTGAIVDQALFVTSEGNATFGTGREKQQKLLDDLKAANNDKTKIVQLLEKAKADNIADVPDIESSVDVLAYIYGEVRRLGLDVHRFINDYTRRPIATMEDILGSVDLEYEVSGNQLKLVSGTPGFHSTAITPLGRDLLGLLDNPDQQLPRLRSGAGSKSAISKNLDPRPGRRLQVEKYLEEIGSSGGSLGVGVEG
jgi:hypothetical protein